MSDFFMSNTDDYWKNKSEEAKANQYTTQINQNTDTLSKNTEAYKQKKEQHYENWNRYGVDVPDEYYDVFNNIIGKAENPEQAQEEAYRIGSAIKYSQMMDIPLDEAYKNVDAYNEANFTDIQGQKGRFEALSDMFSLGTNNVKLGRLGQELMQAHRNNDEELANSIMAQIDAINQQNVLMQDNTPRSWVMQALEAGAQSLPFTGVVAGAGIIGNFIAPAAGTAAAFAASSYLASGQEYIDMLANGATPQTAAAVALVSGGIQGLIEADLGITKGIVKGTARVIGKEAAENAAKRSLEEIGRKVFKRFHFGAGKKVLVNYLENYGKNILGEGTEEFLQEITSIVGQEVAASLDGYDIPDDDFKSIVKQTTEAFRGGVLGALSMGFIPAGINGAADIKEYKLLKEDAEAFESPEMFKDAVKDSPVFEGMSDEAKSDVINEVWKRAQDRKEQEANAEAKKIAEVQDAAEGSEELKTGDDENEEAEPTEVVRDEQGQLYTQDDVATDNDGNVTGGTFVAGNRNEETGNRYGYIKWEYADKDQNKIIINDFKMAKGREGIRAEVYNDFAIQHPGVDIQWNTKGSEAAAVKELLAENNPVGKKNGLNYYADENAVADASTRAWVSKQLDDHIYNIEVVNNQYKKTKLTNTQKAAGVALLEAAAKRTGMSLNEYVNKTFGNEIFGDTEVLQKAALRQAEQDIKEGKQVTAKAGGVDVGIAQQGWKQFGQQVKAVIYAGVHADFSTWTHELAHIFQNQLDGKLKEEAEAAFNVIDGDWINSKYTFKDGHVDSAAEAFAYGFQDWLKTGKAESEQMKNIFQKFAEFIARAYNSLKDFINLSPEITSVYEQLLSGDDSLLKAAEMAVEAEDRRYRAQMQQQAQEAETKKQTEAEQKKKSEEAEREEASELTDFTEEEKALTPEQAEENVQEAANETEETNNAIDNALENTDLTDDQKTQIADVLKDETTTVEEKAEATTDAASSAYIPYDLFQTEAGIRMQYQLAGEKSIQRMVEGEEKKRISLNLETAKQMEKDGEDAATIRKATGWEKHKVRGWQYETDDSLSKITIQDSLEKALKTDSDTVVYASQHSKWLLKNVLKADELFEIFPYLKNIRLKFYDSQDFHVSRIDDEGICLNVNKDILRLTGGPDNFKKSLVHEIQHLIQALEYARTKEDFGLNIADHIVDAQIFYNQMLKAAQDMDDGKGYDKASVDNHIQEFMLRRGEVEARIVASRVLLDANQRKAKTLAESEAEVEEEIRKENEAKGKGLTVRFQKVTDPELLEKLNSKPTIKVYRAMQVIDGKYYPPMATVVDGKRVDAAKPGEWIQADENPELAIPDIDPKTKQQKVDKGGNLKWKFVLDKGGKDSSGKALTKIPAAYNPYWHTSRSPLNDQFSSAYKRPNIVTVEVEVPESELTSGYKAERAKDTVGEMDWHSGPVSSKLAEAGNPRKVILSRYCKIDRVIPDAEVAQTIKEMLDGTDIAIPDNTITPSLKNELEKIGVKVEETEDVKNYNQQVADMEEATKKAKQLLSDYKQGLLFQDEIYTDAFKNWFGDWENDPQNASKVVDENGEPLVVYHGTYNGKFDVFDKDKANPENDFGKGFYFTSNDYDVSENYEGGGPDFENKVARLAERIQQDDEDLSYEEAEQQARDQLYVDDNLFEVYLSMKNPVYVGDNETDIIGELFDGIDVSEEDFEDEDEYYVELDNARGDKLDEIRQAILNSDYDGAEDAVEKVIDFFLSSEYGTLAQLKEALNDGTIEVYANDDNYSYATNDIARIVAEALGYDGIIDTSVSEKFRNMNIDSSTTHYIVFKPNQIKSATENNGNFDPENPSILFQNEEDIQQQVNQLMTMEKAKDMIQRTFVLANIKNWYDGEYANGDEWLKDRGVDEVAMYVDNEWQIQEKFLNNIPALMDGDFTSADIIEAYLNGTLTGPQQQNKEALKPIDTSKDTGFKDDRFYAPKKIDTDAKELLEKASVKVTDANRKEVYKARADFITASHEAGFAARIGMTQAALNKKIMTWAAYPANAAKVSNSINKGVALQNKWTGIENSNLLKLFSIEKEQLMSMVKDVTGNPSEYQLAYVTSVILALDTHIDFSELTYEFNAHIEKKSTMGQYNSSERKIQIKHDSLNTIAHETGHALDHIWGREIFGNDDYLTMRVRMSLNSDKITDPDVKSFLHHFADFLESIENVSDLHSEYTMYSKEVFARFVARFTEWTRNVATNNRFGFESKWYDDKFTIQQYYDFAKILQEKSALDTKPKLQFQKAYHGSGADFDKFDTENYGLSGEGSMTFGYGTYVTDSEDIARDYAERQRPGDILTYRGKKLESTDIEKRIYNYIVMKTDKYGTPGPTVKDFELYRDEIIEGAKKLVEEGKSVEWNKQYIEALEDPDFNFDDYKLEEAKTHLYTVEIPDDGYLSWDNQVTKKTKNDIEKVLMSKGYDLTEGWAAYRYDADSGKYHNTGADLYHALSDLFNTSTSYKGNGDKPASQFLYSLGFAGIKYKAGQIHGSGRNAYNYVIFNDEDAKIVNHLFYQTVAELQDEALSFDNWQDFMEYCEAMHSDDEVSPIPYNADAQWYQSFYETAHGIQTEAEKNEEQVTEQVKKEGALPAAVDALFTTYLKSDPQMIDSFLKAVADIDAIDLDSEEWQHVEDAEGAKQRERYDQLKDFIDVTLSDYNWQTAIKRIQGGHEIAEGLRKRLLGEMTDSYKVRDFRALYAEVMDDQQFAVDEADSTIAQLNKKLSKYKKFDILRPNEDISRVSPERRKRIAEALQNKEIAEKIRNGSLKLDDEIEAYLKSLDKQVKDLQKDYNELEKETKNDYQRLADAERRKLMKLHEELLLARSKLKSHDAETERKIKKGLKITEKYHKVSQNLTANYDELFRKFTDLKNTMQITAEVQAALDRQEQVAGLKENLNNKQKEKNLIAEIKKMRIQLVKRTMRRVPFNRIDYENARTVIAIQRMLEPNLLGGVNRFIGIDSAYLRGVISGIVTDTEYKEKILNYLRKQDKSSQAFVNFLKKVEDLKTIKDFDSWTAKERKYAIKHLPKENWIRDLNLLQLAKEREESIDLDIGMKEKQIPRIDPKTGEPMHDKEGNIIYETSFVLDANDELKKLVRDAVGADMYDLIVDKPFAEWTTEELERLAQRIDELYTEGRDLYAAKLEARKRENDSIRKRVEDAIKETGITINDDDTPEEKERKTKKIAAILNQKTGLKGTEAGKNSGIKAKFDRLINGYADANVLRVSRILDNQSEGENVRLLYRREDECYNNKTRSIMRRGETVKKVMADNKITEGNLAESIKVSQLGTEFTVDELLYFLAADKDYEIDERKVKPDAGPLDMNDDYAATSRNAVMFGNMMSDNASQEQKEAWLQLDKDMQDAIENDRLTQEQKEALAIGQLDKKPGTTRFIKECHVRWKIALGAANNFLANHPEYNALLEAIEADYAEQYERMNEISINEFNTPVHRVRAYVPLVRRESNGDTNVNQVKEDLLGAYGGDAGKQWVNKGMTQRRVNIGPLNQKPVQTGLFRTWADSIERTEHFIAYAPYVRQLNAVYKSRDASYTRRFIEARYGKPMLEYIDNYINEVANPNVNKVRERGSEFLHILRGKTAPAYLGWKFSGIVKQGLTSPWPYMQFVNPAEYLAAATKCWTTGGKYYDAIKEKSAYMASRVMDPINELVDEMADNAKGKVDRAWSNFAKKGMAGLEWIDWTCVAPGWLACYQKEYNRLQNMSEARYQEKIEELTERNMTAEIGTSEWMSREQIEAAAKQELMDDIETEAVRYADDCTRACQPSSRLTDLAPLFKGKSEAMKAFLQFQTSLNVIWQNIRYDIPYNIRQKEFKKIVGTVCGYVLAGIFMNSVMDGIGGDDDDEDTQALRNLIFYSTTQFTDAIPMIGSDITNMMDQVITGKRGFAQSGTDMTPSATKLMSALQKATSGDFKKAASLTAEGIGLGLGAPVSGTKEIYNLLGKPLSEGDINLKRGVSDVYGIAGDILEE